MRYQLGIDAENQNRNQPGQDQAAGSRMPKLMFRVGNLHSSIFQGNDWYFGKCMIIYPRRQRIIDAPKPILP
ncbi:MAG: hypothetical protein ACLFPD_06170, partial [Desulfosudaceae bacterium]